MGIIVSMTFVDATRDLRVGEEGPDDSNCDSVKELFKKVNKEYGKCVSSIFRDIPGTKDVERIGWVFQKRVPYSDIKETYLQEVWVSLHKEMPRTITFPMTLPRQHKKK